MNKCMVSNFQTVPTNRGESTTSKRSPQFPTDISQKLLFYLLSNRNYRDFLLNGKHPGAGTVLNVNYRGNFINVSK